MSVRTWLCEDCKYRNRMSSEWCENPAAVTFREDMKANAEQCDFYRPKSPKPHKKNLFEWLFKK